MLIAAAGDSVAVGVTTRAPDEEPSEEPDLVAGSSMIAGSASSFAVELV